MFKATSFVFDGEPSEAYGVMMYFLDGEPTTQNDEVFTNEIVEDRLNTRYDPIFHGITINKQLPGKITIGSIDYLDRYDVERIADWLTSHNTYK